MATKIKIDTKDFNKLVKQLDAMPAKVMRLAEPQAKRNTPKDTGNARRRTNRSGSLKILSNYDYAGRLDDGYSQQARKGFTDPTIDFIESEIEKQLGRID